MVKKEIDTRDLTYDEFKEQLELIQPNDVTIKRRGNKIYAVLDMSSDSKVEIPTREAASMQKDINDDKDFLELDTV